jgi:putative membrane protein
MRYAGLLFLTVAVAANAHGGEDHGAPGWSFDPWVWVPLGTLLIVFLIGASRLSSRSDRGRQDLRRRAALFLSGWAVLILSLLSPLHQGGERSLTLHMIEHELIMMVAMLLVAASSSGGILAWGLPQPARKLLVGSWRAPITKLWRALTEPITATLMQGVVMCVWHVPALFDRTLQSRGWHIAQHASFILASLLFWWAMLHVRGRSNYGVSAACLFVTSLIGGALGALMSFSSSPWFAPYARMQLSAIGLDPTTDQQLAGLLMWIPGGLVHAGFALFMIYKWLQFAERNHAPSVR